MGPAILLKNSHWHSRPYPSKFFKGSHPQNLLSPLLNTLSQMKQIKFFFWYVCGAMQKNITVYDAHKKSISNMKEKKKQQNVQWKTEKSFAKIRTNFDSIKQLKDNTIYLEETLRSSQGKIKVRVAKNEVIENKAELKEQLRTQEHWGETI